MRSSILPWSLAAISFLLPRSAELGQVHPMPVELEEVLRASPVVVLARRGPEPPEIVSVPLGEGVQPYSYARMGWDVVEWLRPQRPTRDAERITITGFDADTLGRHISYYVHGVDESPIVPEYEPSRPPAEGEPMILFLHRGVFLQVDPATTALTGRDDTFMHSLGGAVEGAAAREHVLTLCAEVPAWGDRLELVVGVPGGSEAAPGLDALLEQRFPQEPSIGWTVVDTRPKPQAW